jgi:hypothetical protein
MALSEEQKAAIQKRLVDDLKQNCLDLAEAAGEMFDLFDQYGSEAAWRGPGPFVVARMVKAHEALTGFLRRQAVQRMIALGFSPEELARIDVGKKEAE